MLYFGERCISLSKSQSTDDSSSFVYKMRDTLPWNGEGGDGAMFECKSLAGLSSCLRLLARKKFRHSDVNVENMEGKNCFHAFVFGSRPDAAAGAASVPVLHGNRQCQSHLHSFAAVTLTTFIHFVLKAVLCSEIVLVWHLADA